jgi:diacylglycerol kinase family enzyme
VVKGKWAAPVLPARFSPGTAPNGASAERLDSEGRGGHDGGGHALAESIAMNRGDSGMQSVAAPTPILVNPAAGPRAVSTRRRLEAALSKRGLSATVTEMRPGQLRQIVAELRDARLPIVAVAGGDGTLRAAAGVLAGSDTALAVIPAGSLNSFARRIGIPGVDAALDALEDGRTVSVSIGVVDDHVFLNTATFGQYATVVRRRERLRRWMGKWPAAGVAFARAVRRLQPVSITIDLPEGTLARETPLLWVGLGRSSFPRARAADVPVEAHDLEVVLARVANRRVAFAFLTRLFLRALRERPSTDDRAVDILHTRHLVLRAPERIEATLDGEVFRFRSPTAVSIQSDGLKVVAPRTAVD